MAEENEQKPPLNAWAGSYTVKEYGNYPWIGGTQIIPSGSAKNVKRNAWNQIVEIEGKEVGRNSRGEVTHFDGAEAKGDWSFLDHLK